MAHQRAKSKGGRAESHVRLYRHELECPAYRSLSTEARALLVEMRALFDGRENRMYMSVREAMRRLDVGRCKAERAFDELIDRGWVRIIERGSFNRKVRHATVFALESEPLEDNDGAVAPKSYMSWTPPAQKNTVLTTSTDGVDHQHRGSEKSSPNTPHGVDHRHRKAGIRPSHGADHQHTDSLPGGASS